MAGRGCSDFAQLFAGFPECSTGETGAEIIGPRKNISRRAAGAVQSRTIQRRWLGTSTKRRAQWRGSGNLSYFEARAMREGEAGVRGLCAGKIQDDDSGSDLRGGISYKLPVAGVWKRLSAARGVRYRLAGGSGFHERAEAKGCAGCRPAGDASRGRHCVAARPWKCVAARYHRQNDRGDVARDGCGRWHIVVDSHREICDSRARRKRVARAFRCAHFL